MTRLPVESRLAVDRPDLPEYELNDFCPVTGESWNLEAHHLFRRSAGYHSWWVELPDGEVIGNRIRLSQRAHERVTVNKARISYENGVYYWIENEEKTPLRWQPPTMHRTKQSDDKAVEQLDELIEPGKECPSCHRRVPHPKKKSSPKTKVYSTRVPIDDADTFKEMVDAAADHIGIKDRPYHEYNSLLVGLALVLQAPKEDLPS